jgi:hypothetical protein
MRLKRRKKDADRRVVLEKERGKKTVGFREGAPSIVRRELYTAFGRKKVNQ